ncbi:hypothetical protein RRH01S_25_00920 [Rhizobium rhizogenes NBRC 13257]|uniref:Uncharacterized protein n=1 Tax=Rhizobium rhizogenes NBRC 13257 TaxID=1220581 RepID=A0AA87QAH2_RHIRH|nr:hypothetical protein RRH01S_25_00920 [Rhizobium rhizogenes NBRC 13257]
MRKSPGKEKCNKCDGKSTDDVDGTPTIRVSVTMAQSMRAAFRASHRAILMIDAAGDSDRDDMTSGLPPASSQDGKDASLKFPNENSSAG